MHLSSCARVSRWVGARRRGGLGATEGLTDCLIVEALFRQERPLCLLSTAPHGRMKEEGDRALDLLLVQRHRYLVAFSNFVSIYRAVIIGDAQQVPRLPGVAGFHGRR